MGAFSHRTKGLQESAGLCLPGMLKEILGRTFLHNHPVFHEDHLIGDMPGNGHALLLFTSITWTGSVLST